MGVLVWSPLARGWLTGRYRREAFDRSPEARAARVAGRGMGWQFDRDRSQPKLDLVEELRKIAADAGVSMTHLAMAFSVTHPGVTSAIIGPRTHEQLHDLVASADVSLDAGTLDAIDALVAPGVTALIIWQAHLQFDDAADFERSGFAARALCLDRGAACDK